MVKIMTKKAKDRKIDIFFNPHFGLLQFALPTLSNPGYSICWIPCFRVGLIIWGEYLGSCCERQGVGYPGVDPQLYTESEWTGKEFHVHPRLEETADMLVRPTNLGGT